MTSTVGERIWLATGGQRGTPMVGMTPSATPVSPITVTSPSVPLATAIGLVNAALAPFGTNMAQSELKSWRELRWAGYFLNSRSSVVQLELIEISHPAFSQIYRVCRNAVKGVTVTLETGGTAFFEYFPLKLTAMGAQDNLDHGISIVFGDLGEILPVELDRVMKYPNGLGVKPTVRYWVYRSDELESPLYGPLVLEVETFSFNKEGSSFEARAPSVNLNRTGEAYTLSRFPMLRGFL